MFVAWVHHCLICFSLRTTHRGKPLVETFIKEDDNDDGDDDDALHNHHYFKNHHNHPYNYNRHHQLYRHKTAYKA